MDIIAPTNEQIGVVIFLHGLGQTTQQWSGTVNRLAERLPGVKWVMPQAPMRSMSLSSGQSRYSWFDMTDIHPCCTELDELGINASVTFVEDLILQEVHTGTDAQKIAIIGFSQGAAMGLMVSLTTLHELAGVASLSGWMPWGFRQQMVHMVPNIPVFWGHGTADTEVPLCLGEECVLYLRNSLHIPSHKICFKAYDGLAHDVSETEIDDLGDWLSEVFS